MNAYHTMMASIDSGAGLLVLTVIAAFIAFYLARRASPRLWSVALIGLGGMMAVAAGPLWLLVTLIIGGMMWLAWPAVMSYQPTTPPLPAPPWLYPVLLGAGLRLPKLLFDPLWFDETFSARLATIPLADFPIAVLGDVHPPTHYFIQWLIVQIAGPSELALRLPALAAGLVLIYLVYRLALAWGLAPRAAWLAAMITAAMPAIQVYSAEARQYSLMACMVLLALIAISEDRPRLFLAAAGSLGWMHNLGFIWLAGVLLGALIYRPPARRWLWAIVGAGCISALWVPGVLIQIGDVADGFWIPPVHLGSLATALLAVTTWQLDTRVMLLAATAIIGLMLLALWHRRAWLAGRDGRLWVLLAGGVPVAVYVISAAWQPVLLPRALLATGPLLIILIADMLYRSRHGRLLAAITAPALFAAVASFHTDISKPDIGALLTGCESVHALSVSSGVHASYYVPHTTVWEQGNDLNQSLPASALAAMQLPMRPAPDPGDCVVYWLTPLTPSNQAMAAAALGQPSETVRFNSVLTVSVWRPDETLTVSDLP